MRYVPVLILLLVLLSSCVLLVPEGVVVTYNYGQVSHSDLRLAIALAQAADAQFRGGSIGEIQVCNSSEVHVHNGAAGEQGSGRYAVIKRIDGQWLYIASREEIIVD